MARGMPRVDCASILALCVAKVERVINPLTDKPPARDTPAGIPSGNPSAALGKNEARLATHDAVVGSVTHEHGESIEVLHASSAVGLPLFAQVVCGAIMVTVARLFGTIGVSIARMRLGNPQTIPQR